MFGRWLEILAHSHEIDIGAAHIIHHLMHLEPLLAQSEHDAGLGKDHRIVGFHFFQQTERSIIAGAGPDRGIKTRDSFQIMIVNVRSGFADGLHSSAHFATKIRGKNLDRGARCFAAQSLDDFHELRSSTVGKIITVYAGDNNVF